MKTVCIYHADCLDGAAAAAVVHYKFPDAHSVPAFHGEAPAKDLKGKRLFIVDFSYAADVLKKLAATAAELHWYDHHKTALPIRDEVGFGILDLEESGATLTWKQLFPNQAVPTVLQYVRDKDLWRWELPDSRDINMALKDTPGILDPKNPIWKKLLGGPAAEYWEKMIDHGIYSRQLLRQRIEKAIKFGFAVELEGHRTFAVNWTEDASEMGEYIYRDKGYPVALIFSYSGNDWSFSLRSDTVDVSGIAVRFGGGGHRGAAGFRTKDIDWLFKKKL